VSNPPQIILARVASPSNKNSFTLSVLVAEHNLSVEAQPLYQQCELSAATTMPILSS